MSAWRRNILTLGAVVVAIRNRARNCADFIRFALVASTEIERRRNLDRALIEVETIESLAKGDEPEEEKSDG